MGDDAFRKDSSQHYGEAMAILVDPARWPWRDALWCHLVSDSSLDELHAFAADLGCRRVGFQGDHYDIDSETRSLAIERGAQPCDSREVVRRIRDAGLRVRPSSFEKWTLDTRHVGPLSDSAVAGLLADSSVALSDALTTLRDVVYGEARRTSSSWFVLRRAASAAVVLMGTAPGVVGPSGAVAVGDDPSTGVYVRLDSRPGGGGWSVEAISPRLDAHQ